MPIYEGAINLIQYEHEPKRLNDKILKNQENLLPSSFSLFLTIL